MPQITHQRHGRVITYRQPLAVDDRRVELVELRAAISARITELGDDVLVVVRADSNAPYAQVRSLLDEARGAGAKRLAIATRQKVEARP